MSNRRYLQQLGLSWYVRIKVPRTKQAVVGNTHIRVALHTRDLDRANELKWAVIREIKAKLARIKPMDAGCNEAMQIRAWLKEAVTKGDDDGVEVIESHALDRAEAIEQQSGSYATAKEWYDRATAKTPFISELLDTWLDGENYKEQTKKQHRAAVADLLAHLGGDHVPSRVTDDVAVAFVEDRLKKSGKSYNTQRRKLNSLVNFWRWLGLRRHVQRGFNPWGGFRLSELRTAKATPDKRPYTDDELITLFSLRPEYEGLGDVMVLSLYTGARLDELCALRMKDVTSKPGVFLVTLRTGKGKTRVRTIAVSHRHPTGVLTRRWGADRANADDQLFPSFKPGGYDGKLSWAVSKAFGRFRDACGLPRGVDFHSLRRNVVTLLENLGVDQVMIARYVGHSLPTLAFTVYSGGSTEQTSREVARRIMYPPQIEQAVESFLVSAGGQSAKAA